MEPALTTGLVFPPGRCGLPAVPSIRAGRLVTDCRVEPAPGPIVAAPARAAPLPPEAGLLGGAPRRWLWARLTAAPIGIDAGYGWVRLIPGPAGTWVEAGQAGSNDPADPAYDPAYTQGTANPSAPVGTVVRLVRNYNGRNWQFSWYLP